MMLGGQRRIGVLTEVPNLLRELGADPTEVGAMVGLDLAVLRNPENSIAFSTTMELLLACSVHTKCPHFGLLLGARGNAATLGLVGRLMSCAPTWGQAIQDHIDLWQHYVRGGMPYLTITNGIACFGYAIYEPDVSDIDQLCDGAVALGVNFMRELCGAAPDEVHLSRSAPPDVEPYHRILRAPVRFESEQSALFFHTDLLKRKLPGADARKHAILSRSVAQDSAAMSPSVADQVMRVLRSRMLTEEISLENTAHQLAMHPRTLKRRLQEEGTTFREIVNVTRVQMAKHLLAGTHISVTRIGDALGYAETSAFSHAFRHIVGSTPLEWRAGLPGRRSISTPAVGGAEPSVGLC